MMNDLSQVDFSEDGFKVNIDIAIGTGIGFGIGVGTDRDRAVGTD